MRTLEGRSSISAGIHHQVDLFGKQLFGSGSYLELRQPGVPLVRLELRIQIGDQISSLLQVCDGATFWAIAILATRRRSTTSTPSGRCAAFRRRPRSPATRRAMLPGLGGLPKLCAG